MVQPEDRIEKDENALLDLLAGMPVATDGDAVGRAPESNTL